VSNGRSSNSLLDRLLMPIAVAVVAGTMLLYLEYRTDLFAESTERPSPTPDITLYAGASITPGTTVTTTAQMPATQAPSTAVIPPSTPIPPTPSQAIAGSRVYDWIPFHVVSSSCTVWESSTHNNFTMSSTDGVFTVAGVKQEGTYWAETAGFEMEESFSAGESITIEVTGSWTGTGSGWRAGVKLADVQNSVFLAGVYDAPRDLSFLTVTTHAGRHEYPLDIGGCGDETIISGEFDPGDLHTYAMTYSERVAGASTIASITSSVDRSEPFRLDLPWRLTNPSIILFASARDIGDSVRAVITDVAITGTP